MYSICRLTPIRAVPRLPRLARFLLVPCVLSLLLAVTASAAGDTAIVVRVLEGRVTDRVTISAPSPVRVSFPGGALEQNPVTITVTASGSSVLTLTVDDKAARVPTPLTISPLSGSTVLTVTTPTDGHRYHGTLTLSAEKGVIVLLNTVPLEEYLLSVVPAELSTRETAALLAQAIVCRTFALANRGRHTGWDLCDLTHCQHYGGVDTETAAGTRAVTETAGLVVTYGGKPAERLLSFQLRRYDHIARICLGRAGRPLPRPDQGRFPREGAFGGEPRFCVDLLPSRSGACLRRLPTRSAGR